MMGSVFPATRSPMTIADAMVPVPTNPNLMPCLPSRVINAMRAAEPERSLV
jgi:hypothetical protein